jgi:hypothetical protein
VVFEFLSWKLATLPALPLVTTSDFGHTVFHLDTAPWLDTRVDPPHLGSEALLRMPNHETSALAT